MRYLVNICYIINCVGATVTAFACLYFGYSHFKTLGTLLLFLALSFSFKFGTAPLFMVSASLLAFYFHETGVWLPAVSYFFAISSLAFGYLLATSVLRDPA